MIIRETRHKRFTTIENDLIDDPRLSAKALGVLVYILSKPDNWKTHTLQLAARFHCGRESILGALKEIEGAGYLTRRKFRNANGLFEWEHIVSEKPASMVGFSVSGSSIVGKSVDGKPDCITNTDSTKTEFKNKQHPLPPQVPKAPERGGGGSILQRNFWEDGPWGQLARELDEPAETVGLSFTRYLEALYGAKGKKDPVAYTGKVTSELFNTPGKEVTCKEWREFESHYRLKKTAPEVKPPQNRREDPVKLPELPTDLSAEEARQLLKNRRNGGTSAREANHDS